MSSGCSVTRISRFFLGAGFSSRSIDSISSSLIPSVSDGRATGFGRGAGFAEGSIGITSSAGDAWSVLPASLPLSCPLSRWGSRGASFASE